MASRYSPSDLNDIKRLPLSNRQNLVNVNDFFIVPEKGSGFNEFLSGFPKVGHRTNAANNLETLVDRIILSSKTNRPVTWALGPHVIKYGLSPMIIQLMDAGLIQCISTNGAGAIHDTEIAMIGETSEEMGGHISKGDFGMAIETGDFINESAKIAWNNQHGFGETLGSRMLDLRLPFLNHSILAQAYIRKIPVTVHVAIGTDIVHMHPNMDGAATGAATFTDFKIFISMLRKFIEGGVHLNIGSTVILPEIFVKAMTCANNLNNQPARNYFTANIDHLSEYRPLMNVVKRGSMDGGEGVEIIGRMEILIPLLGRLLLEKIWNQD